MSGLSGLSNHRRERSFLIWAAVGFFALAIGVSSGDQWTRCGCLDEMAGGLDDRGPSASLPIANLLALPGIASGAPTDGDLSEVPRRLPRISGALGFFAQCAQFAVLMAQRRLPQAHHWVGRSAGTLKRRTANP